MSEQKKKDNKTWEKVKTKTKDFMGKFKKPMNKENRLYVLTAVGCAVALIAIVVVSVAITGNQKKLNEQLKNEVPPIVDTNAGNDKEENDEPVTSLPEGMLNPIASVSAMTDYGFYYNKTLNAYYEHAGVDFMAEKGTEVLAVEDGKVEAIYKDDLLSGTEIVLSHNGGLKTVYRFVTEAEGLKVGDRVEKGQVIATVAEANGDEYKDGAHLHFEVYKNSKNVDPNEYLTLEEK